MNCRLGARISFTRFLCKIATKWENKCSWSSHTVLRGVCPILWSNMWGEKSSWSTKLTVHQLIQRLFYMFHQWQSLKYFWNLMWWLYFSFIYYFMMLCNLENSVLSRSYSLKKRYLVTTSSPSSLINALICRMPNLLFCQQDLKLSVNPDEKELII